MQSPPSSDLSGTQSDVAVYHICKTLDATKTSCLEWVEYSQTAYLPSLTTTDAREIIIFAVLTFATVFVAKQILRLF